MATIVPTIKQLATQGRSDSYVIVTWAAMANGDTGQAVEYALFNDRSVQVFGTFGTGGTLLIEGSNHDSTNPTYATLTDPQGNALSITAAKIEAVSENSHKIRPRVSAGDGTTSLTVAMLVKGRSR